MKVLARGVRFNRWVAPLILLFLASRIAYRCAGIRFDAEPLNFYWQIIDPELLRTDLWRSLFYLQEQMPGFNLFLGVGLKVFGIHYSLGFQVLYLLGGLALAASLFFLLLRLGVRPAIAFLITAVFTANPATVLYENFLFYEYPIAVLFCLAALLWHRYLSNYRAVDGVLLFSCLAMLGFLRVIFHFGWMIMIIAIAAVMARKHWRQTVKCAALPALLLGLLYAKNFIVFGALVPGNKFFSGVANINIAVRGLMPGELERFRDQGKISRAFFVLDDYPALKQVVPLPPLTGIPILDRLFKSTGAVNNLGLWKSEVGRQLQNDAAAILKERRSQLFRSIAVNARNYFRTADDGFPFDGRSAGNMICIQDARILYDRLIGGYLFPKWPIFMFIAIPILLLFGGVTIATAAYRIGKGMNVSADHSTLAFCAVAVWWLSLAVILYTNGDQNRLMFEVSPLMAVLAGVVATRARERLLKVKGPTRTTAETLSS
jgi:hypothetical protein